MRCCENLLLVGWLLLTSFAALAGDQMQVRHRVDAAAERLVFELSKSADYTYFTLNNPHRLVIDLMQIQERSVFTKQSFRSPMVKRVRYSTPKSAADTRLVVELNPSVEKDVFDLPASGESGFRVVVDLVNPGTVSTVSAKTDIPNRNQNVMVVIDPGHGGVDPGSIGPAGTYEKHITLPISKRLANLLNQESGFEAALTRDRDIYISPNDRPLIAVEKNADLMVSIHADAFTTPQPSGASVWVLSKGRADSELGRLLEQSERASRLMGPAADVIEDRETERYFAETIFNMSMDYSRANSYSLSEKLLGEMRQVTKLHKKTTQSASFAVLTAPETTSILVELGFISNPKEEKNLISPAHQQRVARALFNGIKDYYRRNPPEGTLLARKKSQDVPYMVKSGDSLSRIAQRHGISVSDLKQRNDLDSDRIRIGQQLIIPSS